MTTALAMEDEGGRKRKGMSLAAIGEMGLSMEPMVIEQEKHISTLTNAMGHYERIECIEVLTVEIRR